MFKKIVCAILIMLMLVCVFAACNKEPENNGENGENNGTNEGGNNNAGEGENNGGNAEGGGENKPEEPKAELAFDLKEDGTYRVSIGTATTLTRIEIPATHEGKAVTEIGAFGITDTNTTGNYVLKELVIPDSITTIISGAFSGCGAITDVYISDLSKWCAISFGDGYANPMTTGKNLYVNGELLTELTIPEDVTEIGAHAFTSIDSLTSVTIGDQVTAIGANAFYSSVNMKSIEIGSGVCSIGGAAFTNCTGLLKVYIKDLARWCSIEFVNNPSNPLCYAYNLYLNGELLTELTVPESVTAISARAFYNCKSVLSIYLHGGVTTVGEDTFTGCDKLIEVINRSALDIAAGSKGNGNIAANAVMVHGVESKLGQVGDYIFYTQGGVNNLAHYKGSDTELVLPESYNGKNYVIGKNAFYYRRDIISVVIPDTVTKICENAFFYCKAMESVTIGKNVTEIEKNAFIYCNGLLSLTIPDSVKTIGANAFTSCIAMTEVTMGNGVTSIGDGAFSNCQKLTAVYIKDFKKWCEISFAGQFSNPVASAKNLYVNGELLTDAVIPDGVTSIGSYSFINCGSLVSLTLPDSVTEIGDYAFWYCLNLSSIKLGSGVSSIGEGTFQYCYKLAEIVNLSSMSITAGTEDNGFIAVYAIEVHKGESKTDKVGDYLFYICDKGNYLLGYTGTATEITLPESYKGEKYSINGYAFCGNSVITGVTITDGVEYIGSNAFVSCGALTTVNFSGSVKGIGSAAFQACGSLSKVNITDIAAWCAIEFGDSDANPITCAKKAYLNGKLLTNLVIPEGVTRVGYCAFYYCNSLASVTVPASVTEIDTYAFRFCYKLVEIINLSSLKIKVDSRENGQIADYALTVQNGESKIVYSGDYMFYVHNGVNYLIGYTGEDTEIVLPESFNGEEYAVYSYAFFFNKTLTDVTIPEKVTEIGANAFRFCSNLSKATFKSTSGWKAGDTALTSEDVADTAKAAVYLMGDYRDSVWKRS